MGKIIEQVIGWKTATLAVKVSPPSVKSFAVLSGPGLTVNGKAADTVSIPRSMAAAFNAAIIAGRNTVKVTRISRGRPSTVQSGTAYAATLRKAAPARKSRKAAATAPEATPETPTA